MEVLYQGVLIQNKHPFTVHLLSLKHMSDILKLQQIVVDALEDKSILQSLSREEYQYILEGNGLIVGAFVNEELIAFRALLVPPIDEEHLGLDVGLGMDELEHVIYQEISSVHPDFRGNRLQQRLATLVMKELEKLEKRYAYICCTVAPFNIPSLKDKFRQGMEIAGLKEKYDNQLRYIFVKEAVEESEKKWAEVVTLQMKDITAQQAYLAEGWRGINMDFREGQPWIIYGRE